MPDEAPRERDAVDAITPFAGMIGHGIDALRGPVAPAPEESAPTEEGPFYGAKGTVAVSDGSGEVTYVRRGDLAAAEEEGLHVANQDEYYGAKLGGTGQAAVGGINALNGATFDFGLPVAKKIYGALGGDEAEAARALRVSNHAFPVTAGASEFVGALAPALLGAPTEETAANAGEGLLARAGNRFAAAIPRATAEGAAFGVGHQLTEDALGDRDSSAEKILASADGGMVFGGLLGGGLAAGGGAAGDALAPLWRRASEEGGAFGWISKKTGELAEEQAFKSTGAKKGDLRKLGQTSDEVLAAERRIGRTLIDEDLVGPTTTKAEIGKRVVARAEEVGEELGTMRKRLDVQTNERPSVSSIVERFKSAVIDENGKLADGRPGMRLAGKMFGTEEAKPALEVLDRLERVGGERPSFEKLHELRRELDERLYSSYERPAKLGQPLPPGEGALRALRGIMEDEFTAAGERATRELGDGAFTAKYKLAKDLYSDLSRVRGIMRDEIAGVGANRAVSLSDSVAALPALAFGHPVAGVAAGLGNKVLRTYGNQVASTVLDKASKLFAVQKAAARIDEAVKDGVRGFLRGGEKAARTTTRADKQVVTPEIMRKIREEVRDPEALTARVAGMIGGAHLDTAAPNVARALSASIMRIATYLQQNTPAEPAPVGVSILPQKARAPSSLQMTRFRDIVDTVNDPMHVVDELRRGHISRDKVEALQQCYPKLYLQIRAELGAQALEDPPDLTIQQDIALSVLFKEPLSATMKPSIRKAFQDTYAQGATPDETAKAGGPPMKPRPFNRERGSMASGFDRQEALDK